MDRRTWLAERRAATIAEYDAEAFAYEQNEYPVDAQMQFVARLLDTCPKDGLVLDAPCGTGRYFPLVAAAGRRVAGIDQSSGMLAEARAKAIAVWLEHVGLQDLSYDRAFDAVMTIDAMENVSPEDWPLVLARLHRAVRAGGHLYLTVEEVDDAVLDAAHASLSARGFPAVRGEIVEGDVAGYHYYPGRDRVLAWIAAEGLEVVTEEYVHARDAWGYRHFLLRSPG
jgi:cyclopropane fatty-acyl-phospholipid synthase-like methyltransferase